MPFLDHLEELRWRILYSLLAVVIATAIGWVIVERVDVIGLLKRPIAPLLPGGRLVFTSPTEPFFITLKFAFAVGLLLASPVVIYQAWAFLAPALYPREKRLIVPALSVGVVLFLAGAAAAYFWVLPRALAVLFSFQRNDLAPIITADNYFAFAAQLMIAFGLVTELPLVVVILAALGLVTPQFRARHRRYAIVLSAVAAALLTPPDAVSMLLMMVPLWLLYEVSIVCAWVVTRRPARRARARGLGGRPRPQPRHRHRPAPGAPHRAHAQRAAGGRGHGLAAAPARLPRHPLRRRHADRRGRRGGDHPPARRRLRRARGDETGVRLDPLPARELPPRRARRAPAVRTGPRPRGRGHALRHLHPARDRGAGAHRLPAGRRHVVHPGRPGRGLGLHPPLRREQRDHLRRPPGARLPLRHGPAQVAQPERDGRPAGGAVRARSPPTVPAVHFSGRPPRAAQRHPRPPLRSERPGAPHQELPAPPGQRGVLLGGERLRGSPGLGRLVRGALPLVPHPGALPLARSLHHRRVLLPAPRPARPAGPLHPHRLAAPAELFLAHPLRREHRLRDQRERDPDQHREPVPRDREPRVAGELRQAVRLGHAQHRRQPLAGPLERSRDADAAAREPHPVAREPHAVHHVVARVFLQQPANVSPGHRPAARRRGRRGGYPRPVRRRAPDRRERPDPAPPRPLELGQ